MSIKPKSGHTRLVTFLRSQNQTHTCLHTITDCMSKSFLSACVCACLCVCIGHVYVYADPAGTVFKCQTFNLFSLTSGDIKACQSVRQSRRQSMKTCPRKRSKMWRSFCRRTDWRVMRRDERICSPYRWRTEGEGWGEVRREESVREVEITEGCCSRYITTEMKCGIFEFISFIPAGGRIWDPGMFVHANS